jgi:hypothetical protein
VVPWLAVYIALYMVLAAVTTALFAWPATDDPMRSDAIVVLRGEGGRMQEALALARAGFAPRLVVSVPNPADCPIGPTGVAIECFRPAPYTTQGEARWLAQTARRRGWRRTLVVVSNTQATRARIRIRRCYHGGLTVVAVRVGRHRVVDATLYEWGALLKALVLQRSC